MICVFAFADVCSDSAVKNARWIGLLKNKGKHRFIVAVNQRGRDRAQEVMEALLDAGEVELHVPYDEEERPWPWAQNHMFASSARYVRDCYVDKPWLWLEGNDAIPLCDGWLDAIEQEYIDGGQPFLGMHVATVGHEGKPIPEHMSGIGVYPGYLAKWCPKALLSSNTAFDMILAEATLDNMTRSNLIHHVYKAEPFRDKADMDRRIKPGSVIYHTDKTCSAVDILLPMLGRASVTTSAGALPQVLPVQHLISQTKMPSTDLFLKTYPADFPWVPYCIRSIHKFCTGFRKVVVITPETDGLSIPDGPVKVEIQKVGDSEPGYLWQQAVKLDADRYTDADEVVFIDSDCIFTCPVTPHDYYREGKPMWLWTPWGDVGDSGAVDRWRPAMIQFLGHTPPGEMMRRHPFLFPSWFFSELRAFCELIHGMALTTYIMSHPDFTEFNCAGGFAYACHREKFHWINTSTDPMPPLTINQEWSRGGLSDAIKAKMEAVLAQSQTFAPSFGEPPTEIKLTDQLRDSITISSAIKMLSIEAAKSGLHKARIVKSLRAAQVIK